MSDNKCYIHHHSILCSHAVIPQIVLISRESFGDNMQLLVSAALTVMLSVSGWGENCRRIETTRGCGRACDVVSLGMLYFVLRALLGLHSRLRTLLGAFGGL